MKKFSTSALTVATLAVLSTACVKVESLDPIKAITKPFQKEKKKKASRITNSPSTNQEISVGEQSMKVIAESEFLNQKSLKKGMLSINSERAKKMLAELPSTDEPAETIPAETVQGEENLLLGFPIALLGQQNVFGAVITKVSDKKNEELGSLKLTDLTPIHVRTLLGRFEDGSPALALRGCANDCSERSQTGNLISIPIVGLDEEKGLLMVDLSILGQALDLVSMLDPDGEFTKLKAVSSSTTEFDYDLTSLIFDIKTKMIPKDTAAGSEDSAPVTEFTVRWYMKLSSSFNPAFTSRAPTEGVGFFTTDRSKNTKITRWSIFEGKNIHYYIKNVPQAYRPHFEGAIKEWNDKYEALLGLRPITFEHVEKGTPAHAHLVPGDIRYNIIEWDEENKAPYGGLGPSIANQFTGETISANVLIQGPTVIEMYTKWFELSKDIRALRSEGRVAEAADLARNFETAAKAKIADLSSQKFAVKLGAKLAMKVHSQRPELEDPMIKNHFEVVPAGISFDEYMKGYFTEMVAHEIGHNLGLRHNFKGNLGSTDTGAPGSASRSIMEYLGRPYRHLNKIGEYDEMALMYGYAGEAPKAKNWFCTDEHQASNPKNIGIASPECSKSDATSDPFSFWESRVARTLDLIIDMKSASAPVWKTAEVQSQIMEFSIAFANYAAAAEKTGDTWTNFFGKPNRPQDKRQVKAYVLAKLNGMLCDPKLAEAIRSKESQEASELAQKNLDDLKSTVNVLMKSLAVFNDNDLRCAKK